MRRDDIIKQLDPIFAYFHLASGFISALADLIAGSGYESAVFKLLLIRLRVLQVLGVEAVKQKEFESLSGSGIFSMHLAGQGFNLRVLYGFMPDRRPILLLPFFERAGKKATDYSDRIQEAERIFKKEKELHSDGSNSNE
ncbi:MAG: hypothetical protein IJU51_06970 [Clostridia bacterium]|nr:hypothetical protein [Clostridia bacterium]